MSQQINKARFEQNIRSLAEEKEKYLKLIEELKPLRYTPNYRDDRTPLDRLFFEAEDMYQIYEKYFKDDNLVFFHSFIPREKGGQFDGGKVVDFSLVFTDLIFFLILAVQEQKKEIEDLKKRTLDLVEEIHSQRHS